MKKIFTIILLCLTLTFCVITTKAEVNQQQVEMVVTDSISTGLTTKAEVNQQQVEMVVTDSISTGLTTAIKEIYITVPDDTIKCCIAGCGHLYILTKTGIYTFTGTKIKSWN